MALVTSIMRVQQVFLARVERILRPFGLTFARYEVLRLLAFSRKGSMPVGRIGERLQVHPASVTNAVQRLEADGLVARSRQPRRWPQRAGRDHPDSGRRLVEECTDLLNAEVFSMVAVPPTQQQRDVRRPEGHPQGVRRLRLTGPGALSGGGQCSRTGR